MDELSVQLLARWRQGDQQAATALFERYAERLIGLAHARMSVRLAGRVDPDDIVQSVYLSFFTGATKGRYVLQRSGDLWRLLVGITMHKILHQVEHHGAAKRSVLHEQVLGTDDSFRGLPLQALVGVPTPDEAVALTDLVETLLRSFEPTERQIVELKLQGHTVQEIGELTRFSRFSVWRVSKRVRGLLLQHYPEMAAVMS